MNRRFQVSISVLFLLVVFSCSEKEEDYEIPLSNVPIKSAYLKKNNEFKLKISNGPVIGSIRSIRIFNNSLLVNDNLSKLVYNNCKLGGVFLVSVL